MIRVLLLAVVLVPSGQLLRAEDQKPDETAHLGKWRQIAIVMDGKEISMEGETILTVTGQDYTVTTNGAIFQKGTMKIDRTKSPVQSELMVTEGYMAGQTVHQISRIEGDVFISCFGTDWPKEFKSKPGSGHVLSVWIRAK